MTDKMFKEVDAPEHYKAAKDKKIRIKDTGKVQKLTVTDERIPVVPDTPQTGINGKNSRNDSFTYFIITCTWMFCMRKSKGQVKIQFQIGEGR